MKVIELYKRTLLAILMLFAFSCGPQDKNMPSNIVWNGVSENEAASMPFGNGEVAGNVWAEKDGMSLYLARNDCFSEYGRLLKLGKLKLNVGSSSWDDNFTQTLDFASGRILLRNSNMTITVLADSEAPVIWIKGQLNTPSEVSLSPVIWRNSSSNPNEHGEGLSMYSAKGFSHIPFNESADKSISADNFIGFYHHNDTSIFRMSLDNNGLTGEGVDDPFINRTFGALMSSDELVVNGDKLETVTPVSDFIIKIAVTSFGDCPVSEWQTRTLEYLTNSGSYNKVQRHTQEYWSNLWNKSYIQIETPDTVTGKRITEAYNCQRWMTACASLSDFPVKFNGSIFTLDTKFVNGQEGLSPDHRNWGECYWWQNTRLPYYSLVKSGDWKSLKKLFGFFEKRMAIFREQAKIYHHCNGATFPETMTQFGSYAVVDFGIREPGDTTPLFPATKWVGRIMQGPLDLVHMMFDYVQYSGDTEFLTDRVMPVAEEFLEFFIDRNKLDSTGKMRIKNTQSLESFWYGVENDAPTLAGLHAVVKDFKSLPKDVAMPVSLSEKISYLDKVLPDMPIRKDTLGHDIYSPAEKYIPERCNCENPEVMAIFPFKLSTFLENCELGRETYKMRDNVFTQGWSYDGQVAAILGLTDETKRQLLEKIDNKKPVYKFPSYYGPNFDWVPDQDHGGNLMTLIQEMVMQRYGNHLYLLPAFPKDWNVRFKLAYGDGNFFSGEYCNGKWIETPSTTSEYEVVLK